MCVCVDIHIFMDKRTNHSNSGVVMIWDSTLEKETMYFSVKKRIEPGLLQFQLQWLNRGLSGATLTCLQLLCLQFGRYMALYRNNQKPHCTIESHPSRQTCRKPANTLACGAMLRFEYFELRLALVFAFTVYDL